MITDHEFVRDKDSHCGYTWYTHGSGTERVRCGETEAQHGPSTPPAGGIDKRPHSRACGIIQHDHGTRCSPNCPTCGGTVSPEPAPFAEDPLTTHESTKRVLFHLVNAYQAWRGPNSGLGIPNEFTDDAVRIGEQHLRDVDWFPENEGWLANNTDTSPNDGAKIPTDRVLDLIDAELARLKKPYTPWNKPLRWWQLRDQAFANGINIESEIVNRKLQDIRDAYVIESLTRETESIRLYGVPEEDIDAW